MPTAKMSTCVTPEMNPKNASHSDDEVHKRGGDLEHNTIPEDQNRGTSVPTNLEHVCKLNWPFAS